MLAGSTAASPIQGVSPGHHDLSHHGKDSGKLAQLKIAGIEAMKTVRDLLTKLRQSKEDDSNLLDRTSVFPGSNPGDASSHSTKNLPVPQRPSKSLPPAKSRFLLERLIDARHPRP